MELQTRIFDIRTISERFTEFHDAHPIVYRLFELYALRLLNTGHKKIGAKMVMERVRWECLTESKDTKGYKINNDFIAHYARMFMQLHPEWPDCFETRQIKAP